ncbi:putative Major facilitator superfamily MFS_1 [[Clostridium] ultunense Esp]|uniref:MFS transporter n=1 Tax=Thermicanus aegyptius TaxID=94009 RepID=UPI0002B6FC10|nr:MFS transporter [Thermicanus aegyptius]CCQ93902.1 putative Major facilitator superfamily MFS_1 [[Clostridium] ultunense Esp]
MKTVTEWSPWRDRRFLLFASGNFIDNVGNSIYNVVLPLLAYDLTQSLTVMSFLAATLPLSFLTAPLFGVLADRFGSKVLVIPGLGVQLIAALGINLMAMGALGGGEENIALIPLMALALLVQLGGNAYRRGWMAGVPRMFGEHAVKARGSLNTLYVASTILGPLFVTIGLPLIGYVWLLWINLFTYVAPIIVWWLGAHPPDPSPRAGNVGFFFFRDLAEGWMILRKQPQIFNYLFVLFPLTFATTIEALIIYYLRNFWDLSAQYVSSVWIIVNLATLAGSLFASEQKKLDLRWLLTITVVGSIITLFLLPVPILPIVLFAVILQYIMDGILGTTDSMMMVKFIPAEAFGRINGIILLLYSIPSVASKFLVPLIQHFVGVQITFVILGLSALFSVFWLFRKWNLWSDDAPTVPALQPSSQNVRQNSFSEDSGQ